MGASVLLMLSLRPRLMLTPTFCIEDMDTLAMPDTTMDTPMPTMDTTESVLLMLSPRLMLILTFCMEDTIEDILDMPDTTDTLMPSPRLMLTLTFSMEDMDIDTLDMLATTDTPM